MENNIGDIAGSRMETKDSKAAMMTVEKNSWLGPLLYFIARAFIAFGLVFTVDIGAIFAGGNTHDMAHAMVVFLEIHMGIIAIVVILPGLVGSFRESDSKAGARRLRQEILMTFLFLLFMGFVDSGFIAGYWHEKARTPLPVQEKPRGFLDYRTPNTGKVEYSAAGQEKPAPVKRTVPALPRQSPPPAALMPQKTSAPIQFLVPSPASIPLGFELIQSSLSGSEGYSLAYIEKIPHPDGYKSKLEFNENGQFPCRDNAPGQKRQFTYEGGQGQLYTNPSPDTPGLVDYSLFWDDHGKCLNINWSKFNEISTDDAIAILKTLVRSETPTSNIPE